MGVDELKAVVEKHKQQLKTKSGVCMFSEAGPVGVVLIDAVVATLEDQERRIANLEMRNRSADSLGQL